MNFHLKNMWDNITCLQQLVKMLQQSAYSGWLQPYPQQPGNKAQTVAGTPPAKEKPKNWKTKLCTYVQQGLQCPKG